MDDVKIASLLAVAEKKNITRAADSLALTQPAVSHHISQLENELGVVIFNRGRGSLTLTESGEIVVKYAKRMKAIYDGMRGALSDRERMITRLRIGITHTAESNNVAEALAKYGNENPGVVITMITDSIKNLFNMLESYELDLAVVEGAPKSEKLNSLLLDTDYLVCVASNDNPLSKRTMVTLGDLQRQKMILRLPKSGTVNLFASNLEAINGSINDFNVILEVDNIATIKELVQKNMGVSILPKSTCTEELRKRKLAALPIENMNMIRETNIVYQKDFTHIGIIQELTKIYNLMTKEQK